ncbi:WXG100-like domain-containing protein [Micromonospora arborensis]|uniref:WXG100-like domain-containing protein n=1 Tax=Micromonospora arborensis TaxID=2116518 RepID=UPI00371FF068
MGLTLPGELVSLLSMIGYDWPESDETALFQLAGEWTGMADRINGSVAQLEAAARTVLDTNRGESFTAFAEEWNDGESAPRNIADATDPTNIIAIGLMAGAGIVLALKIQVIVQLILLAIQIAQAIATAVVTFGASLLEIPIFKMITGLIVDQLIGMAVDAVLNGG